MISVRPAAERGRTRIDWLDSAHSFSFGEYFDPRQMGFGSLRVINEDRVAPGQGFHTHGHRDMEIISYVLSGALAHRDSTGHEAVVRPGEVQVMGAGTGIRHSEFNASDRDPVHFLQIWIEPDRRGLPPRYQQKFFPAEARTGRLCLVAAPDGRDGALVINQDAALYAGILAAGQRLEHAVRPGRRAWMQVAAGDVAVNGVRLTAGDGAAVSNANTLALQAGTTGTEVLVFDLA